MPPTSANIVNGIAVTTACGPEYTKIVGNPHYDSVIRGVYPNPSNGECMIDFNMFQAGKCRIWIENAYPSDFLNPLLGNYFDIPENKVRNEVRLLCDQNFSKGIHNVVWRAIDNYGNTVSEGFYRVYLQTGGEIHFADILIAWNPIPGMSYGEVY